MILQSRKTLLFLNNKEHKTCLYYHVFRLSRINRNRTEVEPNIIAYNRTQNWLQPDSIFFYKKRNCWVETTCSQYEQLSLASQQNGPATTSSKICPQYAPWLFTKKRTTKNLQNLSGMIVFAFSLHTSPAISTQHKTCASFYLGNVFLQIQYIFLLSRDEVKAIIKDASRTEVYTDQWWSRFYVICPWAHKNCNIN